MPRIRSVHPGLWTDERFASVSPLARLLFIGIWTECDDAGSFEWSPVKLKMRVMPADNADASELLAELEAAGCIMRYEIEGRQLGAVRNFTKYQRPKKPNSLYAQTDEVRNYCGSQARPVRNQFPTGGEKAPQMEDGGGSTEAKEASGVPPPDSDKQFWDTAKAYLGPSKASKVGQWVRDHGKDKTAAAITAAQLERAVEPIAFIEKRFRTMNREPAIPV